MTIDLTAESIVSFRYEKHSLGVFRSEKDVVELSRLVCGLHSQVDSACWQIASTRTRKPLKKEALWGTRELIRTWLPRGTLHTIFEEDLDCWVSVLTEQHKQSPPTDSWLKQHGCTPAHLKEITDAVGAVLDGEPQTREELVNRICQHIGNSDLSAVLRSGWGTLLKPAAAHGFLVFGPPANRRSTFVNPRHWLDRELRFVDPLEARSTLVSQFLSINGVASINDIASWLGDRPSMVRKWIQTIAPPLSEVTVNGRQGFFSSPKVIDSINDVQTVEIHDDITVLPMFDPYVLSPISHRSWTISKDVPRTDIFRSAGWVTGTVLSRGIVIGTWRTDSPKKGVRKIELNLARTISSNQKKALRHEIELLFSPNLQDLKLNFRK